MHDLISIKVFISYSHDSDEHCAQVLDLAQELRRKGINAMIDRFAPHPKEGWPRWMQRQIEDSDFVLAVCTPTYRRRFDGLEEGDQGRGVNWEGFLTSELIYENRTLNERVIPIILGGASEGDIPLVLRAVTHYHLPSSVDALLQRLAGGLEVVPARLEAAMEKPPGLANLLCAELKTKYREISERYTPLGIRKDLRVCPWEPKFVFRNCAKGQDEQRAQQVTLDYVDTLMSFQRLVILGEPGSGKSTGLYVAAHKMAVSRLEGLITRTPIVVNLNRYEDFNSRYPRERLIEMVVDECNRALSSTGTTIGSKAVEVELLAGRFALFFDGLNEVPASLRTECIRSIMDFCDQFEHCNITISSRKYMYNGELPYTAMEVLELGRDDIAGFVDRHVQDGGMTAKTILCAVDKAKWHLFQNPLALHLIIRVFQETKRIPENRALLMESYVDVVLEKHLSTTSRTGAHRGSKIESIKALTTISEIMNTRGLCLTVDEIEQELCTTSIGPDNAEKLLSLALECGLLINEGEIVRFWHHSIQEYFFVLGFYSNWKRYLGNQRSARSHIRDVLKRIDNWETISLAAGLMSENEAELFLAECFAKDEYLTGMVLNQCGGMGFAALTQSKIIKKAKIISVLTYWLGSILEWQLAVRAIYLMILIERILKEGGYAFQDTDKLSLPLLGPWTTLALLQLTLCMMTVILFRRFSDYVVFVRFNTIIRALQHVGSTECRSELVRIFKKFSASARFDVNYLTLINRVIASNICTHDELVEGLNREEEKLYSLTTLISVGKPSAIPAICTLIQLEQEGYALEAALDCIISIANRFPECKTSEQYVGALRTAALNRNLPIQYRLKARTHLIEALGTSQEVTNPTITLGESLKNQLVSRRWVTVYLLLFIFALVLGQTGGLAIIAGFFALSQFSSFSGLALVRIVVILGLAGLIPYLLSKVDLRFQQRVKSLADRKWLALGEVASAASLRGPAMPNRNRSEEITHNSTNSTWRGTCSPEWIYKLGSYGFKHGHAIEYLEAGAVSIRTGLNSDLAKAQVAKPFRVVQISNQLFVLYFVFRILQGSNPSLSVFIIALYLQFADLVFWLIINPHVSLIFRPVFQGVEVEGQVCFQNRRLPVRDVGEASSVMEQYVSHIDGNVEIKNQYPAITKEKSVYEDVGELLKYPWLRRQSEETDYVRDAAKFLELNTDWKIELWPNRLGGAPDILIENQLALDFMSRPNGPDCDDCVFRCSRFSDNWVVWVILIDTPESVVLSLSDQVTKKGIQNVKVWNLAFN